jgi:Holliday junction DNA helicase RuvA
MIANLRGSVLRSDNTSIVLDVSGVGYKVFLTKAGIETAKLSSSGSEISVFTYLAVRENSQDLYGFFDEQELYFFEMLLSVSGIGPKSALGILNIADVGTLRDAISENDSSYLTKVSGIGAKSAQKIVLELQGKIDSMATTSTTESRSDDLDTVDALTALGYSQVEVRRALKEIPKDAEGPGERIKEALKLLGK